MLGPASFPSFECISEGELSIPPPQRSRLSWMTLPRHVAGVKDSVHLSSTRHECSSTPVDGLRYSSSQSPKLHMPMSPRSTATLNRNIFFHSALGWEVR